MKSTKIIVDKKQIILEMDGAVAGGGFTSGGAPTSSSLGVSASTGSTPIAAFGGKTEQIESKKIKK